MSALEDQKLDADAGRNDRILDAYRNRVPVYRICVHFDVHYRTLRRLCIAAGLPPREAPPPTARAWQRPVTRKDCLPGGCNEARPCPWVSCRQHLLSDQRLLRKASPDELVARLKDMAETCALDIVDRGGIPTLEQIGEHVGGLSRQRIHQIVKGHPIKEYLAPLIDATPETERCTPSAQGKAPGGDDAH